MKKRIIIACAIVTCAGLYVNMHFAAQQPERTKNFWTTMGESIQGFRKWISSVYQKSPSAKNVAATTAVGATFIGKVNPYTSLQHAVGSYATYEGVKRAWRGILNGEISDSIAASVLLAVGLGMNFPILKDATSSMENQKEILETARKAIAAAGFTIITAGLISSVFHKLWGPKKGPIPGSIEFKHLKNVTIMQIESALNDKKAYPTPSLQMNALLQGTDFIQRNISDNVVLAACEELLHKEEELLHKKNKESIDKRKYSRIPTDEETAIDLEIFKLKNEMAQDAQKNPMATKADQIAFLEREETEAKSEARKKAITSLLMRLKTRLVLDLGQEGKRVKKPEMTDKEKENIKKYAAQKTELYATIDFLKQEIKENKIINIKDQMDFLIEQILQQNPTIYKKAAESLLIELIESQRKGSNL